MRRGPCPAGFADGSHAGRPGQRRDRRVEDRCHASGNGSGCGGIGGVIRAEAIGRPGEDRVRRAGDDPRGVSSGGLGEAATAIGTSLTQLGTALTGLTTAVGQIC